MRFLDFFKNFEAGKIEIGRKVLLNPDFYRLNSKFL